MVEISQKFLAFSEYMNFNNIFRAIYLIYTIFCPLKIRTMEQKILETINFEVYGIEPMTFIRRYLKAAQLGQNMMIYELSILFMDAMVLRLWADVKDASTAKKESISCPDLKLVLKLTSDALNFVVKTVFLQCSLRNLIHQILSLKLIYSEKAAK